MERHIRREKGLPEGEGFTAAQRVPEETNFVRDNVFAIDFDEKTVRVARTLNLIAGDGQTNVLHLNTLDYSRWNEITKQEDWNDTYNEGFKKLKKLQPKGSNDYSQFQFDLVMANPPFAGDIKENTIISRYELGKNSAGKWQNKVGRDILFIERNLNFLKPGGRMAIVLPQGRFNNSSDKAIREYIAERCRILAVVGLHGNVFKPHAAKTSDSFSVVTEQVKPFGIDPPKCKHDEILNSISDYLIKQDVGVKSWPGTKTSANHMVLNIYRIVKSTRNWLNESPNLFVYREDLPEDICFYRDGKAWMYVTTHERDMAIINPTDEDMAFFETIEATALSADGRST